MKNPFVWLGNQVKAAVDGVIESRLARAGNLVVQRARQYAPVRTGALRASIAYSVTKDAAGKWRLVISVGMPYGIYQEFGTRNIPPHPFIRPALNEIGRVFGGQVEMNFANPGGHGLLASTGAGRKPGYAASNHPSYKPLTAKQIQHVQGKLIPGVKKYHTGNTKRARFTVGG